RQAHTPREVVRVTVATTGRRAGKTKGSPAGSRRTQAEREAEGTTVTERPARKTAAKGKAAAPPNGQPASPDAVVAEELVEVTLEPAGLPEDADDSEFDEAELEDEVLDLTEDDEDAPAQQVTSAGATADPVKDYLKQIGRVPLLNAEQEVELAKRIEAGLFAQEKLAK